MKDLLSPQTKSKISYLGYYQLIGGGIGGALVIVALLGRVTHDTASIIMGSFLLFFGFSILCGILCIITHRIALTLSLINQLLQFISITVFGISASYVAGIYFIIGFNSVGTVNYDLGFGISRIHFYLINDTGVFGFGFNMVAFALIIVILRLMRKVNTEIAVTSQFSDWK